MEPDRRIALLEEDIARFQRSLEGLERDKKRLPWSASLLVLVVPGGWFFGAIGALLALGLAAVIALAMWYLVDGHRAEYENRIRMTRQEIAERQAARGEASKPAAPA